MPADKSTPFESLNTQQRMAIAYYAQRHGRTWKDDLARDWWTGRDANQDYGNWLRIIRNTLGPLWLEQVVVPAQAIKDAMPQRDFHVPG